MTIFESEENLLSELDKHDRLLRDLLNGVLSFRQYLEADDDFYWRDALDGHESDEEELALFAKHTFRIEPYCKIAESLIGLASDDDAVKPDYIKAGRFGSNEAIRRIKVIAKAYSII